MEALKASCFSSFGHGLNSTPPPRRTRIVKFTPYNFHLTRKPSSILSSFQLGLDDDREKFKLFTAIPSTVSTGSTQPRLPEQETEDDKKEEKFDWYSHWYPIMPLCDLDKRKPHGKRVVGLDVVVWWDKNENEWRVFDDSCPHRLAPLSEGRIDKWGRLQCIYHGWCFGGSGDCKLIPQAPPDGPPVHTFKKACVSVYPSTVQNDILWFWPNSDPQFKDILQEKKPPFIPEIDDPSYARSMINRDIPYGYEVLVENLMDPAHVAYAHYKLMGFPQNKDKADREGGRPLDISIQKLDPCGFISKLAYGGNQFIPPCLFYGYFTPARTPIKESASQVNKTEGSPTTPAFQKRSLLVFYCIPVSPGNSRVIFTSPRNFGLWINRIVPRWMFHVGQNLILDSDLYLLHVEERKLANVGPLNWQKACFIPTKSDAQVVAFRRWLKRYTGGRFDWSIKSSGCGDLPPTPPRDQLMDRYWSHVVNCTSCSLAYKVLNALEIMMQVISVAAIGIVAVTKPSLMMPTVSRTIVVVMAVLCFLASRWFSHFIYKNFHYHDYSHAFV